MENNMTVKTGANELNIAGVVKQHNLNQAKGKNGNYINGSITVKAGEFTEIRVKVMVSEKTKNGKLNKKYQTLQSIINKEYLTMADKVGEEEAVKVSIWGNSPFCPQFKEEIYCTDDSFAEDEAVTSLTMDLGFANITVKEKLDPSDYKAEFDVDIYVTKVVQEEKNGIPTERTIIYGVVPTYQGSAFPIEIIAGNIKDGEEVIKFGEQIQLQVYEGMSLNLFGDINHQSIIEKVSKGGGLGRAKTEEKRTYIHELVAQGADFINDSDKAFDQEAIKNAMIKREEAMREKIEEFKNKKGNGKSKGLGSQSKSNEISDDVIPF